MQFYQFDLMLHSLLLVAATPSIMESHNYKYLNISYF